MKNNIKKPLNTLNDIDKKILPFFSSPIILKRISDQKKNINFKLGDPKNYKEICLYLDASNLIYMDAYAKSILRRSCN